MPSFVDDLSRETWFKYDVEGRRTAIQHPNGAPAPTSALSYDVVGNLVGLDTTEGSTDVLPLAYGYDLAGNRTRLVAASDSLRYVMDDAGRLVEEDLNGVVEQVYSRFVAGTVSNCHADPASASVSLLPFGDSFAVGTLNADRWRTAYSSLRMAGMELRPLGGSLQFCFPRGFSDLIWPPPWGSYVPNYGLTTGPVWAAAENRQQLTGDFDVMVDFTQYQGKTGFGSLTAALYVSPTPFEQATGPQYDVAQYDLDVFANNTCAFIGRDNTPQYHAGAIVNGAAGTDATATTSDTGGRFRIQRSGSTVTMYYWNAGTSSWSVLASYAGYSTAASYVALYFRAQNGGGSVGFQNFGYTGGSPAYPSSGTYTSAVYDAGRSVSWATLDWTAQTPGTSAIKFQVAVSSASLGPWTYVGPDGTSGTYFTASPATLPTLTGRYFRYQATLTGDGTVTPTLSAASASFSGTNASTVRTYSYDGAGNMTEKITTTPTGSPTSELRDHPSWSASDRINPLNQILRNDVATGVLYGYAYYGSADYAGNTVTTWRYTYDLSGNLTSKTDGTNTWRYAWDEDNRLTQVTLPDTTTVSYTYDVTGRMLTRTDSSGTTKFEWDGFDCARELAPTGGSSVYDTATYDSGDFGTGGATLYYVVGGELIGLKRDNAQFAVVSDALGSVRLVLDSTGATAAHFEYDAWGNLLASSVDNVPVGGMPYRFVGSLGVRYDSATGLHYMRQRWYDAGLGRFVSRDALGQLVNAYSYARNGPTSFVDPVGLASLSPSQARAI